MKEDLSKNRDFKMNWSGFEVYREYRVELGRNIWKNGRKTHILGIFGDLYRYTLNLYRYSLGSGRFWLTCTGTGQSCTGTGQSCTGTGNALFSCFDQFSYFSFKIL